MRLKICYTPSYLADLGLIWSPISDQHVSCESHITASSAIWSGGTTPLSLACVIHTNTHTQGLEKLDYVQPVSEIRFH